MSKCIHYYDGVIFRLHCSFILNKKIELFFKIKFNNPITGTILIKSNAIIPYLTLLQGRYFQYLALQMNDTIATHIENVLITQC